MAYRRRYFEGEVTTPLIVPGAVTEEKIADNSITSEKIKDETIKSVDIGSGQVRTEDISDGAVTLSKLGADVSIVPLLDGSVTTTKLADGAVTAPKIGDSEVTSDKIRAGAVSSLKLADGAVISAKIATSAVTQVKIAPNSVGWSELRNDSVQPGHIRAINPPAIGLVPAVSGVPYNFEWITPGVSRPITPPVATGEIGDNAVTKTKLSYKVISITIPALQVGGLFPPLGDPDLNGGVILGYSIPTNQDQLLRQLFLLPGLPQGTGVSILLNAPAIVDNTFDVVVLRQ